ncbi:hypothetical protein C7447_102104 [Tenacibaculum adriaticum]|uniref:Uncharacterized protein n=1 Tax=Tenacibaculum adriaticum TaxID=413713 RepID=A0A5S5DVV9_9FLAO|nr:hypothetical protein [Tenacibaculum adriaticum]TYP98789.1 hypothetical protein C7447_102104 [Tenacibaculum adriaticum]
MLQSINLQEKLLRVRNKKLKKVDVLAWVQKIFIEVDERYNSTEERLKRVDNITLNQFNINKTDTDAIFHIDQIKKICIDYRLRFLDAKYFKSDYPSEVIIKIHQLEKEHNTKLHGFKIVAPSVLFKLKKADDPMLFVPMSNDYYYLVHKWGNDMHPLRKFKYWVIRNVGNFGISLFVTSLLLTLATHSFFFREHTSIAYFFLLFVFYLKGALGLSLFYGISSGKNFSEYAWRSKYDKIC